jgi:hypothetical protein
MGLRSLQSCSSLDYVYVQQYPSLSAKVPQQRRGRQTRALDWRPQQRYSDIGLLCLEEIMLLGDLPP